MSKENFSLERLKKMVKKKVMRFSKASAFPFAILSLCPGFQLRHARRLKFAGALFQAPAPGLCVRELNGTPVIPAKPSKRPLLTGAPSYHSEIHCVLYLTAVYFFN